MDLGCGELPAECGAVRLSDVSFFAPILVSEGVGPGR